MIIDRDRVREAIVRALRLDPDLETAIASVAQALCLSVEAVAEALEPVSETAS